MRFFKKALLFSFIFWSLSARCFSAGLNNLEFLTILADSLLEQVTEEVFEKLQNKISIKSLEVNTEVDWFIENQLVKALQNRGFDTIYLKHKEEDINSSGNVEISHSLFEFKVLNLSIDYSENTDNGLSKSGYAVRKGNIRFLLRVVQQPSGEFLWNGILAESKHDWILTDQIKAVENQNVAFTKGDFKINSGKIKILEPVLISGVTGIIVFLFYSLRSR